MQPIPRVLAILQGGPFNGQRFSTVLDGEQPPVLVLSGPDAEIAYEPEEQLNFATEHGDAIEHQRQARYEEIHPVFQGFELHDPELYSQGVVQGHLFVSVWKYQVRDGG